jgi:hypothetical protein
MIAPDVYETIPIKTPEDLEQVNAKLRNAVPDCRDWLFRGVSNASHGFRTSLERAVFKAVVPADAVPRFDDPDYPHKIDVLYNTLVPNGVPGAPRPTMAGVEAGLIRQFKRKCHQFLTHLPLETDWLEWLSLMQHYGAPTRLVDWTYSLYAAAFFAVDRADTECAVWGVDAMFLAEEATRVFRESGHSDPLLADNNPRTSAGFEAAFNMTPALRFVRPVNPYRLNERLTIQQGSFLCQGDVNATFEANFEAILRRAASPRLFKVEIPDDHDLRRDILRRLHRMNMNRATLFPGLSGFAESLSTQLLFPQTLVGDTGTSTP